MRAGAGRAFSRLHGDADSWGVIRSFRCAAHVYANGGPVVKVPVVAEEFAAACRQRIDGRSAGFFTTIGMTLPVAFILSSIGLMDIQRILGLRLLRGEALRLIVDSAFRYMLVLGAPWEAIATIIVAARWRDVPQRFWVTYCVNVLFVCSSLLFYWDILSHFFPSSGGIVKNLPF